MAASSSSRSLSPGWESVPADVLERLCMRLSVADVCRMRAVCREWSTLLCSQQFMDNYASWCINPAWDRWIVVYTDEMHAFVSQSRWASISNWRIPRHHEEEYQADCVADSNLVCLSRRSLISNSAVVDVFVFNPLTKVRFDLPPIDHGSDHGSDHGWPKWRPWALWCTGHGSFRALFLGLHTHEVFLCDSTGGAWDRRQIPKEIAAETSNHKDEFSQIATTIDGIAYCVNWDRSVILTYNIQTDSWDRIQTPLTRHSRSFFLIEPQIIKGRNATPILVAGVRKRNIVSSRCIDEDVISIWELDTKSMDWTKISETKCELSSYTFAGNEAEVFVIPHASGQVLAFDFSTRLWKCLPPLPSRKCFSMATFSIEARF